MPHCLTCDSHVSADYARVYGDNEGRVHVCRHCPVEVAEDRKRSFDSKHVGGRGGGIGSGFEDVTGEGI